MSISAPQPPALPTNLPVDGFIDLHAHTTESDGSFTPAELVDLAIRNGVAALGITDHDTFAGYELAAPYARAAGLPLVRGIELNSRLDLPDGSEHRSAHMLAYFPVHEPTSEFHTWLESERNDRRERNRKLAGALQQQGLSVTLQEVEARGKTLAGRVHFAQILIEKGYVDSIESAFQQYLGEGAATYVERESPSTEATVGRIRDAGGIPVVAHPIRLSLVRKVERQVLSRLKDAGLLGLEVAHSDHSAELQDHYRTLASEFGLLMTGGSDFHGKIKPHIELGSGIRGNVRVPAAYLRTMQQATQPTARQHSSLHHK